MWVREGGKLVHVKDRSRTDFKTRISGPVLDELKDLAAKHDTFVNYLIEEGLKNLLAQQPPCQKNKPGDRQVYKSLLDKELLEAAQVFASQRQVYVRDLIEQCVPYIDLAAIKKKQHMRRIEET